MNATQKQLHDLGQRLWLDNITHVLLTSGTLSRYITEFAVRGQRLPDCQVYAIELQALDQRERQPRACGR